MASRSQSLERELGRMMDECQEATMPEEHAEELPLVRGQEGELIGSGGV